MAPVGHHLWPYLVTRRACDGHSWSDLQRWIHQWMNAAEGWPEGSREWVVRTDSKGTSGSRACQFVRWRSGTGVQRRTVRQALESAARPERKPGQGVAWRLEPFQAAIAAMLVEDTTAPPRKQRYTACRILPRLIEEHAAEESSYSSVGDCPAVVSGTTDRSKRTRSQRSSSYSRRSRPSHSMKRRNVG